MKIYCILVNGELMPAVYTSLAALCKDFGLGYSNIAHGKRLVYKAGVKYELKELSVKRIKGRGGVNRFR